MTEECRLAPKQTGVPSPGESRCDPWKQVSPRRWSRANPWRQVVSCRRWRQWLFLQDFQPVTERKKKRHWQAHI